MRYPVSQFKKYGFEKNVWSSCCPLYKNIHPYAINRAVQKIKYYKIFFEKNTFEVFVTRCTKIFILVSSTPFPLNIYQTLLILRIQTNPTFSKAYTLRKCKKKLMFFEAGLPEYPCDSRCLCIGPFSFVSLFFRRKHKHLAEFLHVLHPRVFGVHFHPLWALQCHLYSPPIPDL